MPLDADLTTGVTLLIISQSFFEDPCEDMNDTTRKRKTHVPISCGGASFVVTIDGKPYAGFVTRAYAGMALGLWSGDIDGGGLPLAAHESRRMSAGNMVGTQSRGCRLEIVER